MLNQAFFYFLFFSLPSRANSEFPVPLPLSSFDAAKWVDGVVSCHLTYIVNTICS